jgi:hypothetical protein
MNTSASFIPEGYYHVYNQTNGKELLFKSNENRRYFLQRFHNYLKPFLFIHSYALLSNHFHFSVQVKNEEQIAEQISNIKVGDRTKVMNEFLVVKNNILTNEKKTSEVSETSDVFNRLIIHQWQRFFLSYTKSFNKAHNRLGNLFRQKFKRSAYDPELKFHYLQYYINHNARKHGIVNNFIDYKHTSYNEIINENDFLIDISKIFLWYSEIQEYVSFHEARHYEDVFENIDMDGFIRK